jgi:hypothetical protein
LKSGFDGKVDLIPLVFPRYVEFGWKIREPTHVFLDNIFEREFQMHISLPDNRVNGFTKWSLARLQGSNDDDQPGGATPIAITATDRDDPIIAPPEQAPRPRLVRGVGAAPKARLHRR